MTLTSHGHHIPGTTHDDEQQYPMRHRCGGPDICEACSREATMHWHPTNRFNRVKDSKDGDKTNMRRDIEMLMNDLSIAEAAGNQMRIDELKERLDHILQGTDNCPNCTGTVRQTVGMVCPVCGKDYSKE